MSIGLTAKLVETATKITTTRNAAGDRIYGSGVSTPCLYRDISLKVHGNNREEILLDGILWFDAGESVAEGDIYYHPSEGYLQIQKVTKAKQLVTTNALRFIKCGVSKQRQVS